MPVLPPTSFNSSQLIRFLASLGAAEVAEPNQTFAERLSQWLDWTDAISLSRALNVDQALNPSVAAPGAPSSAPAVIEEFNRVRKHLAQSITADTVLLQGGPAEEGAGFSALRRHHLAHQRAMEAGVGLLRVKVRAALSALSPELGTLAQLDAVLGEALSARERHLLATVPMWLERHFAQARKAAPSSRTTATPGRQVQSVLLAELDTRLQPIEGMIEALADHGHAANKKASRQP